jgi:hypothetical protein
VRSLTFWDTSKRLPDFLTRAIISTEGLTELSIRRPPQDFIVDFAHHVINREGNNSNHVLAEMTDIQSEMNEQKDQDIVAKLQWLLDYYYWTISTNPNWNSQLFEKFHSSQPRQFSKI